MGGGRDDNPACDLRGVMAGDAGLPTERALLMCCSKLVAEGVRAMGNPAVPDIPASANSSDGRVPPMKDCDLDISSGIRVSLGTEREGVAAAGGR
jgi:hypothetical protein